MIITKKSRHMANLILTRLHISTDLSKRFISVRNRLIRFIAALVERIFAGSDHPGASQIVDGALAIQEGLKDG